MSIAEPKTEHLHMIASKLGVRPDSFEHIGSVPWDARHGYIQLCNCQGSILFAVQVTLSYLATIRDSEGADTLVLQGKCPACEKIYVAETRKA